MNGISILVAGLAAFAANAQPTNTPPQTAEQPAPAPASLRTQGTLTYHKDLKLNEITLGHLTCSGIAVEAARAQNPLQLVNPAAPPQYGQAEDNVVLDPFSGRASGLKLFAIRF